MNFYAKLFCTISIVVWLSGCASDVPVYRGAVLNGTPHGSGWKEWPNGEKFEGEWGSGAMVKGIFTWPNGNRYEGSFLNDQRNGRGTMTFADGGRYEGEWQAGSRSGQGEMTFPNKDHYKGGWASDLQNGNGTLELANGNLYVGRFVAGVMDGDGAAMAFYHEADGKWCISDCVERSTLFAVVAGVFSSNAESQSVTVKACGTDAEICRKMVAPALLAFQQARARKLAEAEKERERLAAEAERERLRLIAEEEKEKARKAAAILAEKKRIEEERRNFLATATAAELAMDADRLEADKDYKQASEVYRIVVKRFPEGTFAAAAMARLGAIRDKRDQQEAEEKKTAAEERRLAAEAADRAKDQEIRREEIAARKADAEKAKAEAAHARAEAERARAEADRQRAQQQQSSGGGTTVQDELIKQGTKKVLDQLFKF